MGWGGLLGFQYGVVQPPLGPHISRPPRVAAVAGADGLGLLRAPDQDRPNVVRETVCHTRKLTSNPYVVEVILDFPHEENVMAVVDEKVAVRPGAWGDYPKELVHQSHAVGVKVVHQVGSVNDAEKSAAVGVDAVIVQGVEAGGHVIGQTYATSSTKEAWLKNNLWNPSWVELELADLKQSHSNYDHGIGMSYSQNSWGLGVAPSGNVLRLAENNTSLSSSEPAGGVSKVSDEKELSATVQSAECTSQKEGIGVLVNVLFHVIQRCISERNLAAGREVHHLIRRYGLESHAFLGCHLIRMFAFFELLPEANLVFSKLSVQNAFAWSAIIAANAKLGQNEQAIKLYNQMRELNVRPDGHVFVAVLKACATIAALTQGMQIHIHIIDSGFQSDIYVGSSLIHMYARCGSLEGAHTVFNRLSWRNMVIWNALIAGYAQHGHCQEALYLFQKMQQDGMEPDKITFLCILKACSTVTALNSGKWIHAMIIGSGLELDLSISSSLIDLYAKCERIQDACILFDKLSKRDVVTWSALIVGYAHHQCGEEALHLFQDMLDEGMQPTPATFTGILKAFASTEALQDGKWIHALIIESGVQLDVIIGNALIDMYSNCRSLQDACMVFDSLQTRGVVSWSVLIAGYTQNGCSAEALQLFEEMRNEGLQPDGITVVCALKACSTIAALQQGKQIHTCIIEMGWESDVFVGSILVDMYVKCGSLDVAKTIFDRLPKRDVVMWTALISGFAENGNGQAALCLFQQMQKDAIKPDQATFVSIIKACSTIAALEQGKRIHSWIIRCGLESELFVSSTLIDMYAKCGSLQDAITLFDRLPNRGVVTWSALIAGYAQHGKYMMAFQYFEKMQQSGLKPDNVAFLCLLSACSHLGILDKGCLHFKSMTLDHGIQPMLEHFTTMVDLFGHTRCLNEAEDLLETIPFGSNVVGWTCLLSSCRKHGNVDIGRRCFDNVVAMDPRNAPAYVLMAKTYAVAGMIQDAGKVETTRLSLNAWKKPAKTFIEIDNQVHDFVVGDKTHPRSEDIYAKLKTLSTLVREEKCLPRADFFMNQILGDDKELFSFEHSEKLAIAFGLISTPKGATIRVSKNVRVCADCHIATQIMSKVEMREIIVTDAYQIHHFKDGACSCNDYDQQEHMYVRA